MESNASGYLLCANFNKLTTCSDLIEIKGWNTLKLELEAIKRPGVTLFFITFLLMVLSACSSGSSTDTSSKAEASVSVGSVSQTNNWPTSLAGRWDDSGVQEDGVGSYVIIDSNGGNSYTANFYSRGQSGGVFDQGTAEITDKGHGLAKVDWNDGSSTIATWGVRTSETESDMDPEWNGDIWFDCIGHLVGFFGRASCDFRWSIDQS